MYRPKNPPGQSGEVGLMVMEPWARASLTDGGNSAIYLNLMNQGGEDDVLLGVSTEVAEATELHETKMDENDVMQMSPVTNVAIPAGATVALEPGGKHIMLIGLTKTLQAGDTLNVTLTFEKAGEKVIEAEIRDPTGGGHDGHDMEQRDGE